MRRPALLLAASILVGCANEPTAVSSSYSGTPRFTIGGTSAGGVSFASGSGCTVVLSHFECSFTADGVGSDLYSISQRAQWSYRYICVHKKNGRESARYPEATGFAAAGTLTSANGDGVGSGHITVTGTVLAPSAPTDCAANKGAYTTTAMRSNFIPTSWSLYVYSATDPDNHYASIFETL